MGIITNMATVTDMAMARVRLNHQKASGGNYAGLYENLTKTFWI
jgi:hypothetical protein